MIKETIFSYFGNYFQLEDTYKENDPQNLKRGVFQRYQELLGSEFDLNLLPKIDNILENTKIPKTIINTFVPLREQSFGLIFNLYNDIDKRKKLLQYIHKIHKNRGTKQNYIFLLGFLNFDVQVNEFYNTGSFDDGNFDSGVLDTFKNIKCKYDLVLTCRFPFLVDDDIQSQVWRIIRYNHPIHAQIRSVVYLGASGVTSDFDEADFDLNDFN